jgi:rare lipoprotein A
MQVCVKRFVPLTFGLLLTAVGGQVETVQAQEAVSSQQGKASYYGHSFHGRKTASGERFNQHALVAAHPSLPFGSVARVTNLRNGRSAEVRIVDRGPARSRQRNGVIIDLSLGTANALDFVRSGRAPVRVDVLQRGRRGAEQAALEKLRY